MFSLLDGPEAVVVNKSDLEEEGLYEHLVSIACLCKLGRGAADWSAYWKVKRLESQDWKVKRTEAGLPGLCRAALGRYSVGR